jgi:hypothetical protein
VPAQHLLGVARDVAEVEGAVLVAVAAEQEDVDRPVVVEAQPSARMRSASCWILPAR